MMVRCWGGFGCRSLRFPAAKAAPTVILMMALIVAGCASKPSDSSKEQTRTATLSISKSEQDAPAKPSTQPAKSREPFASVPRLSRGDIPTAVQVTIYQLSVPYGTVSRNEKFWKRIDETVVDVTTNETLFKNGIRVGEAPTSEWDYFKNIMEENPAVTRINSLVSMDGKTVELPMRKEVQRQDLFYFDNANMLHGRSFDACENIITMVLQPAPRKRDTVRLTMCPVVRSMRKRLEYSSRNEEKGEIVYAAPEHLYDLNLRVDIPIDTFFVVAPSGEATWPTSVGNGFFVHDGAAERMETVLLMVPQIVNMQVGPMQRAAEQMPTNRRPRQAPAGPK
jgi:hypothetical protein